VEASREADLPFVGCLSWSASLRGSRVDGVFLDKSSDQAQQSLLFRTLTATQEGGNVLMLHMPTRRRIGLVMDEQSP
jgi:hypothetical protein